MEAFDLERFVSDLHLQRNEDNLRGMARYGIATEGAVGLTLPKLRALAKQIPRDHQIALDLWTYKFREARILATYVDRPQWVTLDQMDSWVKDLNSWDLCDGVCKSLFKDTPWSLEKAREWPHREEEFVRRAGFVLMAEFAVHHKKEPDSLFISFFPLIRQYATDPRNYVKKAVNWSVRQIGKRNPSLKLAAIELSEELIATGNPTARWIGRDAFRELNAKRLA